MTRKTRRLVIALAALAVLAGALLTVNLTKDRPAAQAPEVPRAAASPLVDVPAADLRSLVLENPGGGVSLGSPDGESWVIADAPKYYVLDQDKARTAVSSFANVASDDLIDEDPADPAAFGLDPPEARVTATASDGRTFRIEIGRKNPSATGRYVRIDDGAAVYLMPAWQSEKALWTLRDLRDASLPKPDPAKVSSFSLRVPGKEIRIEPRQTPNPYGYSGPAGTNLEISAPWRGRYLVGYRFAEILQSDPLPTMAADFADDADDDPARTGLGDGADRLMLADSDGTVLDLLLGGTDERGLRYARLADRDGPVFLLDPAGLGVLDDMDPVEITDKFVLLCGIDNVAQARVDYPDGRLTLGIERRGDPDDRHDDLYTVNGLEVPFEDFSKGFQLVSGLSWDTPLLRAVPLTEPEVRVQYSNVDPEVAPATLRFWPYDQDFYVAVLDSNPAEFLIAKEKVAAMITGLEALSRYGS